MNGTEAASNYRKVRNTRISRVFDIHCLGALRYMLTCIMTMQKNMQRKRLRSSTVMPHNHVCIQR